MDKTGKENLIGTLNSLGASINEKCDMFSCQLPSYYARRTDKKCVIEAIRDIENRENRAKSLLLKNALRTLQQKQFKRLVTAIKRIQKFVRQKPRRRRKGKNTSDDDSWSGSSSASADSSVASEKSGGMWASRIVEESEEDMMSGFSVRQSLSVSDRNPPTHSHHSEPINDDRSRTSSIASRYTIVDARESGLTATLDEFTSRHSNQKQHQSSGR